MQSTITDETGAIAEVIEQRIGSQKYNIWFKNSTKLTIEQNCLKVEVPNAFIAKWIQSHFLEQIRNAIANVTERSLDVSFAIDSKQSGSEKTTVLADKPSMIEQNRAKVQAARKKLKKTSNKKLRLTLDTFVVGRSNQLAYNAANTIVSEQQSPFNPLFIHGGYGIGKTHLLQGICNAVEQNRPHSKWLYLSAEDFVNQFVLALKTKKLEAFRCRMRQTDLLAIDDIHFLASKTSMQEEFLHTFNTIDMAGKQIILASDAHPKLIGRLSEKLVSRFVSGMVVKIDPPDYETRCKICTRYAQRFGHNIGQSVIKYTAQLIKNNVRELEGALLKLVAIASLQNQKITLALAKKVFAEHLARTDPIVHITDIESVVASYFGITPNCIHSSKKNKTISLARHYSMYLARKHTNMSTPEIGRCMGNKNHATVLMACRKIEDQVKRNAEISWIGPNGNRISKAKNILNDLEKTISA
jgi:chromosomal replication initiator protein